MPEQYTDEQIEVLFADLRADVMTTVLPPGPRAVRHTVRNRRAARSVAAGAALIAVAGGVAVAGRTGAATDDTWSDRDAAVLARWSDEAAVAVGSRPERPADTLSGRGPVGNRSIVSHRAISGTYTIAMACVGDGTLTVVVRTSTVPADPGRRLEDIPQAAREELLCRPAATAVTVSVAVPDNGMFAVDVQPDAYTAGRAAFAYRARLLPADQHRLANDVTTKLAGGTRLTAVMSLSEFLDDTIDVQHDSVAPGSYRFKMSCVGAGAIQVSARIYPDPDASDPRGGTLLMQREVSCGPTPTWTSVALAKSGIGALLIRVEPDGEARGQSAASFRLDHA